MFVMSWFVESHANHRILGVGRHQMKSKPWTLSPCRFNLENRKWWRSPFCHNLCQPFNTFAATKQRPTVYSKIETCYALGVFFHQGCCWLECFYTKHYTNKTYNSFTLPTASEEIPKRILPKKKVADRETCCTRWLSISVVAGSCTEHILRAECRKETQRNLFGISAYVPAPRSKKRAVQREASCFMELSLEALTLHLPYLLTGSAIQEWWTLNRHTRSEHVDREHAPEG